MTRKLVTEKHISEILKWKHKDDKQEGSVCKSEQFGYSISINNLFQNTQIKEFIHNFYIIFKKMEEKKDPTCGTPDIS